MIRIAHGPPGLLLGEFVDVSIHDGSVHWSDLEHAESIYRFLIPNRSLAKEQIQLPCPPLATTRYRRLHRLAEDGEIRDTTGWIDIIDIDFA